MDLTVTIGKKELEEIVKEYLKAKNLTAATVKFNVYTEYEDHPMGGSFPSFKDVTVTITKF